MIRYFDKKTTANKLAKELVWERGSNAEYWGEATGIEVDEFTAKEIAAVDAAVEKQIERVRRFLGVD